MALRALTSGWKVEGEISAVGGSKRRWLLSLLRSKKNGSALDQTE